MKSCWLVDRKTFKYSLTLHLTNISKYKYSSLGPNKKLLQLPRLAPDPPPHAPIFDMSLGVNGGCSRQHAPCLSTIIFTHRSRRLTPGPGGGGVSVIALILTWIYKLWLTSDADQSSRLRDDVKYVFVTWMIFNLQNPRDALMEAGSSCGGWLKPVVMTSSYLDRMSQKSLSVLSGDNETGTFWYLSH